MLQQDSGGPASPAEAGQLKSANCSITHCNIRQRAHNPQGNWAALRWSKAEQHEAVMLREGTCTQPSGRLGSFSLRRCSSSSSDVVPGRSRFNMHSSSPASCAQAPAAVGATPPQSVFCI